MKYNLAVFAVGLFVLMMSCKPINKTDPNTAIEVLETYSELQTIIDDTNHQITVLNFWSTTCAPCIKEMPHFNQLAAEYQAKGVNVLLVNLENPERLDSHIFPFVKKHGIIPEVVLLNDQNYNIWTDFIDKDWYGALPATLILKGDKRNFKFGIYKSYKELQSDVTKVMEQTD